MRGTAPSQTRIVTVVPSTENVSDEHGSAAAGEAVAAKLKKLASAIAGPTKVRMTHCIT